MSTVTVLNRLVPRSIIPDGANIRATGFGSFAPSDIAAALSGSPAYVTAALLGKYLGDCYSIAQLKVAAGSVLTAWRLQAGRQDWIGHLNSVTHAAVTEFVTPRVCSSCLGAGIVRLAAGSLLQRAEVCPDCLGYRSIEWSQRKRARIAGVEWRNWRRHWQTDCKQLLMALREWEGRGLTILAERLG